MSHLNFHILSWGFSIEPWHRLQKKAIRAITCSHYLAHTKPIFKRLNLANLPTIFETAKLKFYFKFVRRQLPDYFLQWKYRSLNFNHGWYTRYGDTILTNIHNTDYIELSLKFSLKDFINSLSDNIKNKLLTHSIKSISKEFRNNLISAYSVICIKEGCHACLNS